MEKFKEHLDAMNNSLKLTVDNCLEVIYKHFFEEIEKRESVIASLKNTIKELEQEVRNLKEEITETRRESYDEGYKDGGNNHGHD
jgi:flagellar biosynthesis/type III secretory pathway protein FliH